VKEKILFFFLLSLAVILPFSAQNKIEPAPYVPRQYASVEEALASLKDCGAEEPKGLCDDFAVDYLAAEYWKGNKKILPKIMEVNHHLMGAPAEGVGWFLGDVLEKETAFFLESMHTFPADLQMHVAYSADLDGREMLVSKAKSILEKLYSLQKNRKLGCSATFCIMAIENMLADKEKYELRWECEKRPPLAPAGGKIWGMDCATNKLLIGDYYTNQEVTIILSDQTTIIGSKGGKISCTDMKPGDRIHVWPNIKIEGVLYNTKPVEALIVVVEN